MLKNIPDIISPDLMKVLMEMGHGDEICFGDANYPAQSMGADARVIRCDGLSNTDLLDAVLKLFPLDVFVKMPVSLMQTVNETDPIPLVWEKYRTIIQKNDFCHAFSEFEMLERYAFYVRSKKCFAVVATTEHEGYSPIILKKGVIF